MNVGTAHSEVNPNTRVMSSRGMWLSYILGIGLLHVVLLSIPFASVPVVWTLTNLIHNLVSRDSGCRRSCVRTRGKPAPLCVCSACTCCCTRSKARPSRRPTRGRPACSPTGSRWTTGSSLRPPASSSPSRPSSCKSARSLQTSL